MTDLDDRFKSRCPRQLKELPNGWCPLAVMRLKAMRNLVKEPTDVEEQVLPGCPWAIANQMAGYCWFVYEAKCMPEVALTDVDIASNLGISAESVKKAYTSALNKMQSQDFVKEARDAYGDASVVDAEDQQDPSVYCD